MKIPSASASHLVAMLMAAKAATKAKVAARLARTKKSADDNLAKMEAIAIRVFEVVYDSKVMLLAGSAVGGAALGNDLLQIFDRNPTKLYSQRMEARVSEIEHILKKPKKDYVGIAIVIAPPKANGDQEPLILSAQRFLVDEFRAMKEEQEQERGWRMIEVKVIRPESDDKKNRGGGDEPQIKWRTKGVVSKVRNQLHCNSCWAFVACAISEAYLKINNKDWNLGQLSVQELIDYHGPSKEREISDEVGCLRNRTDIGLKYIKEKGISLEANYQFEGRRGDRRRPEGCVPIYIPNYKVLPKEDPETQILQALEHQTVGVTIAITEEFMELISSSTWRINVAARMIHIFVHPNVCL